jgi:hypothetical protein
VLQKYGPGHMLVQKAAQQYRQLAQQAAASAGKAPA